LKLIITLILTAVFLVHSQAPSPERKIRPMTDNSMQEHKALDRQISYAVSAEKRGDLRTNFNIYANLLARYETDLRVVTGYIDAALKVNQIKECETKIKAIALKHPAGTAQLDPSKKDDHFKVFIQGAVAEVYLRTAREQQTDEVFRIIDGINTTRALKSEIKAGVYLRSGRNRNAEKLFVELRKESKNDRLYSKELFGIYLAEEKPSKFTGELLKLIPDNNETKTSSLSDYGFDPAAELFRLYENDRYKDSILAAVEKVQTVRKNAVILSELYFNSGNYERSYAVLKKIDSGRDSDYLAADYGIRLYNEKKYSEASDFFDIVFIRDDFAKDQDFMNIYLSSLELSGKYARAEEVLLKSRAATKDLLLARLYHNHLKKPEEARRLYEKSLTDNKSHSAFWHDYILLLISESNFIKAKSAVERVFDKGIMDIFKNDQFYEFKYLDAVICLFLDDTLSFMEKTDRMIKDDFISDLDNDLIEIQMDLKTIGDDTHLKNVYLNVLAKKINPAKQLSADIADHENVSDVSKLKLIHRTNMSLLIYSGRTADLAEYSAKIIFSGMMDSRMAKMFTKYSSSRPEEKKLSGVLFEILKTDVDESVKAEIRELMREKIKT
jgi:hypothetical protein